MFKRLLDLPEPGTETFFLWGPRQTGKSTLLRSKYGDGRWVSAATDLGPSSCARNWTRKVKAFENWVFHELSAFMSYREVDGPLS